MIHYNIGFCSPYCRGSVVPTAIVIALPSAFLAIWIQYAHKHGLTIFGWDWGKTAFNVEAAAYTGYVATLGFLVIFRTSAAYQRFVSGNQQLHHMTSCFFESALLAVSFSKSAKDSKATDDWRNLLVRLYSLLNGLCLAKVEGSVVSETRLNNLEVIDLAGIDPKTLHVLFDGPDSGRLMLEKVYCWITQIHTDAINGDIVNTPPPIAGRILQKLAEGRDCFEQCRKIASIPFPFPYAQATLWLMVVNYVVSPFVMVKFTHHMGTAFLFTFLQPFLLWSLILISRELENPFGNEDNDLDIPLIQRRSNDMLTMLLSPDVTKHTPTLSSSASLRRMNTLADKIEGDLDASDEEYGEDAEDSLL